MITQPQVPVEPLLPFLHHALAVVVCNEGVQNGRGIRALCQRLSFQTGYSFAAEEKEMDRVLNGHVKHVTIGVADRWLIALGYHPVQVYGDLWLEEDLCK